MHKVLCLFNICLIEKGGLIRGNDGGAEQIHTFLLGLTSLEPGRD